MIFFSHRAATSKRFGIVVVLLSCLLQGIVLWTGRERQQETTKIFCDKAICSFSVSFRNKRVCQRIPRQLLRGLRKAPVCDSQGCQESLQGTWTCATSGFASAALAQRKPIFYFKQVQMYVKNTGQLDSNCFLSRKPAMPATRILTTWQLHPTHSRVRTFNTLCVVKTWDRQDEGSALPVDYDQKRLVFCFPHWAQCGLLRKDQSFGKCVAQIERKCPLRVSPYKFEKVTSSKILLNKTNFELSRQINTWEIGVCFWQQINFNFELSIFE